jgi:hypothetical protein
MRVFTEIKSSTYKGSEGGVGPSPWGSALIGETSTSSL